MQIIRVRWLLFVLTAAFSLAVTLGSAMAEETDQKKKDKATVANNEKKTKQKGKEVSVEERAAQAKKIFEKRDSNSDGNLSFEEFQPKKKKGAKDAANAEQRLMKQEKRFSALDKDGDKLLSLKEFSAAYEKSSRNKKNRNKRNKVKANKREKKKAENEA